VVDGDNLITPKEFRYDAGTVIEVCHLDCFEYTYSTYLDMVLRMQVE